MTTATATSLIENSSGAPISRVEARETPADTLCGLLRDIGYPSVQTSGDRRVLAAEADRPAAGTYYVDGAIVKVHIC